jgi:hypothetical protein
MKATTKAPRPMENEVQSGILALLVCLQIPHFRSNAGGGYRLGAKGKPQLVQGAPEGWPDITGWLPKDGRFLGIEVKRPGERPTDAQVNWMRRINEDGGVAFWCDNLGVCHAILVKVMKGWRIEMGDNAACLLRPPGWEK